MAKLYMIGNTHFDPVWEWTWDEAMASIRATFRSALDRMKETPDFCYSFSSPPVFEWIKKTNPDMFEEIRQRVAEGRWDLAEGWWNQPDCFSASGESYVRQGLYGQRYLMKNFEKYSCCAFNTDSFGHPDMLPQILLKSGIRYYCLCRPEEYHYHLESPLFVWKSRDGSSISAFRIGLDAGDCWAKNTAEAMEKVKDLDCDLLMVYGVTDHGGAPTKKSINEIIANKSACFSSVENYFKNQHDIHYEINGEFVTGDFGVYCNNSKIKQLNRKAEYVLLNAEKSCVISGEIYTEKLSECWQDIIFNQFHDILGGASIKKAYTDARNLYGRAIQTASEILHFNLQKFTSHIQMPGKNPDNVWNLAIWNLNGCEYEGYVEAEVQWAHEFEWYDGGITLEDADGNKIETQIIEEYSAIPKFRSRFIFKVQLPAIGYKCFKVIRNNTAVIKELDCDIEKVETKNFVYTILKKNASIKEVYNKKSGKIIQKNMFVPNCYEDNGDTWCFNIESYGELLGQFKTVKAELIENGRYLKKIRFTLKYNDSLLKIYYKFYNDEDYFEVDYTVNWNEKHTVFKFDNEINEEHIKVSTPYSQIKRNRGKADKPMGEWIETNRFLLMAGGNFSYNFFEDKLGITVLRSPVYGDFRMGDLPQKDYMIMEQGETAGHIRILFNYKNKFNSRESMCFNNVPIVICESNHDGSEPPEKSFVSLHADKVMLNTVKHSEDDDSVILRTVDYSGQEQEAVLTVFNKEYKIKMGAYEIKTLKWKNNSLSTVNLIEKEEDNV